MIGTLTIKSGTDREITVENVEMIHIHSESCDVHIRDEDIGKVLTVARMSDVRLIPCRNWQARPCYVVVVDKTPNAVGRLEED